MSGAKADDVRKRVASGSEEASSNDNVQVQYPGGLLWQSADSFDNSFASYNEANHDSQSQRNAEVALDLICQVASYPSCRVSSNGFEPSDFPIQRYQSYSDEGIAAHAEITSSKNRSSSFEGLDDNLPPVIHSNLSLGGPATGKRCIIIETWHISDVT